MSGAAVIWRIDDASPTFQARASVVGTARSRASAQRRADRHNANAGRLGYPSRWVVLDPGETPAEHIEAEPYELDPATRRYLAETRSGGGGAA